MRDAFSDENRTTSALLAVLALVAIAFVMIPTRRIATHRPPAAQGRIDSIEPKADAGGRRIVPARSNLVVVGRIYDDRHRQGRAVSARLDGASTPIRGRYGPVCCGFMVIVPAAALAAGDHHLSVWLEQGTRSEPLMEDVAFTVQ